MPQSSKTLTRRKFVQTSLTAGASAILAGCTGGLFCPGSLFSHEDIEEDAGVVVVGSGFGGAIAANRLTAEGIAVTLIEKGRRWDIVPAVDSPFSRSLPADRRSTWLSRSSQLITGPAWPMIPYVGVLERQIHDGINVYMGACYGGGSVVYGGVTAQPVEPLFSRVFPPEISYAEMDQVYFPRALARLRSTMMPNDILEAEPYRAMRVFREQLARTGLPEVGVPTATDWDVVRGELSGSFPASATVGDLIFGNNSGCKLSLDRTLLADAEATGLLTVHLLTRVKDIERVNDGRYRVHCETIDESGCVVGKRRITCRNLFLAAGSVATTSLLLRARETGALPELSDQVGEGWGHNGNVHFMRDNVGMSTGRIQGGPPAFGVQDFEDDESPIFAEHAQFPSGYECECLLHLGIALEETRGRFTYDPVTDAVTLRYPDSGYEMPREAAMRLVEKFNDANGGALAHNLWFNGLVDGSTYHPLGGVVMGRACDFAGRVNGYPRLYVVDSALVPGSTACVNPALTIAAIAERCMDILLAEEEFPV